MNSRHHPRNAPRAAFTLIELLTVIAIIAILMGLLMAALGGAKDQARRADAAATVRNIVNSCKSYYNDYGKYPPVSNTPGNLYSFGDSAKGTFANKNSDLFDVLRAISRGKNVSHALNKRQQKYFESPKAKDPKNPRSGFIDGSEFTTGTQGALMDPWGTQYCILLDATGNDEIAQTDIQTYYQDMDILRFSAVAFCLGKDGERGGKGYIGKYRKTGSSEAPDDIVSWQ